MKVPNPFLFVAFRSIVRLVLETGEALRLPLYIWSMLYLATKMYQIGKRKTHSDVPSSQPPSCPWLP
eukprot:2813413-Amphidinium_carterae.1